jgi:hypothetical protein
MALLNIQLRAVALDKRCFSFANKAAGIKAKATFHHQTVTGGAPYTAASLTTSSSADNDVADSVKHSPH